MKKTNNKGFSLVELIVVIAIMAVLVGVLAPQFLKFVERGRKSTDVQNVSSIVTALQTYAADPMVDTAKALGNGATITITDSSVAVSSTNATNNANEALTAAGIKNLELKSSKWGATTIHLNAAVGTDGSVVVTCTDTLSTGNDIIKGLYK